MTDQRSSAQIERDIEHERERLTDNLESLQDRFSADTIIREIGNQFRENGGEISRSVSRSVKENPMALAITGVGLAWMIFGSNRNTHTTNATNRSPNGYDEPSRTLRESSDPTGRHTGHLPVTQEERELVSRHQHSKFGETAWAVREIEDDFDDHDDEPDSKLSDRWDDAKARAANMGEAVQEKMSEAQNGAANCFSDASNRTKDGADQLQRRVDRAYRRLAVGTEDLSDAARDRIVAARRDAMLAREQVQRSAKRGADKASDMFEQQPLVAGALALAVGAAVGAAVPRTRMEDDMMGERSDALFADAERIYREERDKAQRVLKTAQSAAQDEMADVQSDLQGKDGEPSVAEIARHRTAAGARRVASATREAARKEGLGSPNA